MELIAVRADAFRRAMWQVGARTAFGRRCLRDRASRVSVLAAFHIVVALSLTLVAPVWLLLVGPLVLGVPHVLSDVRFLLLSPGRPLSRPQSIAILVPLAAMTLLRVALVAGAPLHPAAEGLCGAIAIASAAACSQGRSGLRALCLIAAAALAAIAILFPMQLALCLGHLHNLVAIGLWAYWMRGRTRDDVSLSSFAESDGARRFRFAAVSSVFVLFFAGVAILCSSVGERIATASSACGLSVDELVMTLAPGLPPGLALRLLSVFAFAQAVHYALWVRIIPETRAAGPPAPTFRRGWQSLQRDFGATGSAIAILCTIALPLAALIVPAGPAAVRNTYLSLILFHGWLELAAAARLLADRAPAPQ